MDNQTKQSLSEFSKRAMQRLEDKKVVKHRTLYIPSMDMNIKIRSLSKAEIAECIELSNDDSDDGTKADNYTVYISVVEPDLRAAASELKSEGAIIEYADIVDMFEASEVRDISMEIMKLSGVYGLPKVKVVDELEN